MKDLKPEDLAFNSITLMVHVTDDRDVIIMSLLIQHVCHDKLTLIEYLDGCYITTHERLWSLMVEFLIQSLILNEMKSGSVVMFSLSLNQLAVYRDDSV